MKNFDIPSRPGRPEAVESDKDHITIKWSSPISNGGSPIIGYDVERRDHKIGRWFKLNKEPSRHLEFYDKQVHEGHEYEYRVSAVNAAGNGKPSESLQFISAWPMIDAPGRPGRPEAAASDKDHIYIKWSPPISDGGSPIIGYDVERRDRKLGHWVKLNNELLQHLEFYDKQVHEGHEYEYRVSAVNAAGKGKPSESPKFISAWPMKDISNRPGRPEPIESDKDHIKIKWSAPFGNGGSPIIGYDVQRRLRRLGRWAKLNEEPKRRLEFSDDHVQKRHVYEYRVSAVTEAGHGKPSDNSQTISAWPMKDIPSRPGRPKAIESDEEHIKIKWTPPISNGGSPIIGYDVQRRECTLGRWLKLNNEPLRHLEFSDDYVHDGQEFEYRVRAVNAAGSGEPSERSQTISAWPLIDIPSRPFLPEAVESDKDHIKIKWSPPISTGGSPTICYDVERRVRKVCHWVKLNKDPLKRLEFYDDYVQDGQVFEYRVFSVKAADNGQPSFSSQTISPWSMRGTSMKDKHDILSRPFRPKYVERSVDYTYIEWSPPINSGGSHIIGFNVERRDCTPGYWYRLNNEPLEHLEFYDDHRDDGKEFEYRVSALNAAGNGCPAIVRRPFRPGS